MAVAGVSTNDPLQVVVSPSGDATWSPAGSVSVKPMPVRALVLGLLIVNVRVVVPLSVIEVAPKALVMVGGTVTLMFAEAVLPVPALVEVTAPVVFVKSPPDVPFTFTEKVQLAPTPRLAPDILTVPPDALIVPQDPVRPLGEATIMPDGIASLKATPVSPMVFEAGFVIVKLRVVVPFTGMRAAPNALVSTGGSSTARLADAVAPLPPAVEVTALVVLVSVPAADATTLTENVHEPLTARFPPVRLILMPPAFAVIVPAPQVPVSPVGVAMASPVGNVSVKPMPVSPTVLAAGLVTVKLRVVVPPSGTDGAPKALVIIGGATTGILAVAVFPAPLSSAVTAPVVFVCWPAAVPVTFTPNVHESVAGSVAPDKLIVLVPAVAMMIPPPQLPVETAGVDTTRPAGNASLNATP